MTEGRRFYGAQCPSYPDCTGGCGLGCMHELTRGAAQPMPDDLRATEDMTLAHNVRQATIEECARTCEARIQGKDGLDGGNDWGHNAPYNAEDKACAAAIRALATQPPDAPVETDSDGGSLVERLRGRALYLRNMGEVKSPELMEQAATALSLSSAASARDALEQIAIVCTDNMDRDCDHRMALDFVRQIANDHLDVAQGSLERARRLAQGYSDFWCEQAEKNESRREHYDVLCGQFQKVVSAIIAAQPPAAPVETGDTSSDGGGESRPASTEPQASASRRPQGLTGEAGVAPSPSDTFDPPQAAPVTSEPANKPAIDPKKIKAIDDFLADGERDKGYRAFAMMRHLWPRLRELALGEDGAK